MRLFGTGGDTFLGLSYKLGHLNANANKCLLCLTKTSKQVVKTLPVKLVAQVINEKGLHRTLNLDK